MHQTWKGKGLSVCVCLCFCVRVYSFFFKFVFIRGCCPVLYDIIHPSVSSDIFLPPCVPVRSFVLFSILTTVILFIRFLCRRKHVRLSKKKNSFQKIFVVVILKITSSLQLLLDLSEYIYTIHTNTVL